MAQEGKITQGDVDRICAELQAKNVRPTTRLIRAEHGAGSTTTIQRMLEVWQGAHPRAEAAPVLSEALQKAMAIFLKAEADKAKDESQAELASVKETLHDVSKEGELLAEANARMHLELETLNEGDSARQGQIQQLQADLASAHEELERVRAEAEQARQARAVAEIHAAEVPKMEKVLADLRAELAAEQKARNQAEQAAAVAHAQREGAEARMADERTRSDATQAQLRTVLDQVDKLQKAAAQDAVRVEAAHARLEDAHSRMTSSEKRANDYKEEAKAANAKASELMGEARTLQAALEQARKDAQQEAPKEPKA